MRMAWLPWLGLAAVLAVEGCGSNGRGGPASLTSSKAASTSAASSASSGDPMLGTGGGSACSDEGACGTETHTFAFDAPNLYFVFDASGSMNDIVKGKSKTRYEVVRETAVALVDTLGPTINVGAALFPSPGNGCDAGYEALPMSPGDPFSAKNGPTLSKFKSATNILPKGGTPTAKTLATLAPTLATLKGKTIVLLLTDGGPNCNPSLTCEPDECIPVIEGECPASAGCCDPGFVNGGPRLCIDRAATVQAVESIHALGIDVYVIGVADLEAYEDVLDEMAVAGGVANAKSPKYTDVKDLDELGAVFAAIAASAIDCNVTLKDPPADKGYTNLYFDCMAVPFDAGNGWTWTADDVITLHGASCDALKSGKVGEVKIVTGCPTEVPK